jgi:hypothetical protein
MDGDNPITQGGTMSDVMRDRSAICRWLTLGFLALRIFRECLWGIPVKSDQGDERLIFLMCTELG